MNDRDNENTEIRLLLEAINLKYGYDFRSYSRSSIRRSILRSLKKSDLRSISEMQHRILYNEAFFEALLLDLSVTVTEMFRNPSFFKALRDRVLPELGRLPAIRIWHAGCATGEEVYSMAIILRELGIHGKSQLYATDINEVALHQAREGIFPAGRIKHYTRNYQAAGGTESFGDYYSAHYDSAIMNKSLKENIVFADHNLVTDADFGEMNMIICRNVLIYFSRQLQDRAFRLFSDSLCESGFLCIGSRESVHFCESADEFESLVGKEKIYRKWSVPETPRGGGRVSVRQ